MKWVSLFKQKRSKEDSRKEDSRTSADDDEEEEEEEHDSKRRMVALEGGASHTTERCRRHSLDQWFEARSLRTCCDVSTTTTTGNLRVFKAGSTTLINSKYIVIKHLGTGSYGQVKLAFNLMDKRLYAIKACKKSQLGCPSWSHAETKRNRGSRFGSAGFGPTRALRRTSHGDNMLDGRGSKPDAAAAPCQGINTMLQLSQQGRRTNSAPLPQLPLHAFLSIPICMPKHHGLPSSQLSSPGAAAGCREPASDCTGHLQPAAARISAIPEHCAPEQQQQEQQQQQQQDIGLRNMAVAVADVAQHMSRPSQLFGMQQAFEAYKAENFVREITILKKLSHPNIVKLVEVIDDPSSDNLLLVMEYVEGKTLQSRQINSTTWEPEPEMEVWRRARDVLQGLEYLHSHEVVHGDLKPANLILDSNTHKVKIVDFGSAVLHSRSPGSGGSHASVLLASMMGPGTMACTPAFRSPESLQQSYRLSYELDMWALGVTLYLWIFGQLPFSGGAPFIVYESIRKQPLLLPADKPISAELRSFLQLLLEKDPAKRMDVAAAIAHPWVTACGVAPLAPAMQQRPAGQMDRSCEGSEMGTGMAAGEELAGLGTERAAVGETVRRRSETHSEAPMLSQLRKQFSSGSGRHRMPSPRGMSMLSAPEALAECLSSGQCDEGPAAPSESGSLDGTAGACGSSGRNLSWSLEGVAAVLENEQTLTSELRLAAETLMSEVTSRSRSVGSDGAPARPSGGDRGAGMAAGPTPALLAPSESFSDIGSAGSCGGRFEPTTAMPPPPAFCGSHRRRAPSRCGEAVPGAGFRSRSRADGPAAGGPRRAERVVQRGFSRAQLLRSVQPEEVAQAVTRCCVRAEEVVGLVFEEVHFVPRQQIISAGDAMAHVYLLIKGEVELCVAMPGAAPAPGSHAGAGAGPIISGLVSERGCCGGGACGTKCEAERDCGDDDDEEVMMDFLQASHDDCVRPEREGNAMPSWAGHHGAEHPGAEASDAARTPCMAAPSGPASASASEVVLTVKGPGDSLGVVNLGSQEAEAPTWRANVRAKGEVVALRAEVAGLQRLAQLRPELAAALSSFAGQQATDHQVVEALRRLHADHVSRQWQAAAAAAAAAVAAAVAP